MSCKQRVRLLSGGRGGGREGGSRTGGGQKEPLATAAARLGAAGLRAEPAAQPAVVSEKQSRAVVRLAMRAAWSTQCCWRCSAHAWWCVICGCGDKCRDRQAVSFPFFIRCRDACPALVLRRSIVAEIVRLMKSSQKHTKLLGRCMSLKSTPEHTVLSSSPLRLIGTRG